MSPNTIWDRISQYALFAGQFAIAAVIAQLTYAATGNALAAVGSGLIGLAITVGVGFVRGIPSEFKRDQFVASAERIAGQRVELGAAFVAVGLAMSLVAVSLPIASLTLSFPLAFFSNVFRVRTGGIIKQVRGLLMSLLVVVWSTAIGFYAIAHLPDQPFSAAQDLLTASGLALVNLFTLGLDSRLPADGWPRAVGLFEMATVGWWLYAWLLLPRPWLVRPQIVDPKKFFGDPLGSADDFVVVLALTALILKTDPGDSSQAWFWITVALIVGAFPAYWFLADRSMPGKWRVELFTRVVVVQLWLFTLMYFAGSNSNILGFAVDGVGTPSPHWLTPIQAIYVAIGTLITAGSAGVTAMNDPARLALAMQFVLPAVFALWLFGAAEWLRVDRPTS